MNTHLHILSEKTKRIIAITLIVVLGVSSVAAGLLITQGDGIATTTGNGITYVGNSGVTATTVDGLLGYTPNGITAPTISGITTTGLDGLTYSGANNLLATGVDGLTTDHASGIILNALDGQNGLLINSNGNSYQADSVLIQRADGIILNALDNLSVIGGDGIILNALDGIIGHADGITLSGFNGITINGAEGIILNALDGGTIPIPPGDLTILGPANGAATDVSNIVFRGADSIILNALGSIFTGADSINAYLHGDNSPLPPGLRSVDVTLVKTIDRLSDDSNVNAAVVFHSEVTDADIGALRQIGVLLGQRYHVLPVVTVTATKRQILQISHLPRVRSIYSNRTLKILAEPGNGLTGTERVKTDADLTAANGGQTVIGRNVTVAVLDTGLDSTHGDLSGRVVRNVSTVGAAGLGVNFTYPLTVEGLPNTDLVSGHGTFVGGVIAGNGARSSGRYTGVAPGAKLVGVSVGVLDLLSVIEGFDYILWKQQELGIKVVNCSFSADTLYSPDDPVSIASKMLTDRGVSVVFSAGNNGPGMDTLNPYAMAPWVVSVGATDAQGKLASFSSIGSPTTSGPTLVAPGVNVVSLRASGVNVDGLLNLGLGGDLSILSAQDLLNYTVGSGTSFSAPQVVGTIAMMLDANPSLTPAQIKNILQSTATPLPPYVSYQVGAGMLNAHAAVLKAAFPQQARYVNDPPRMFSGTMPLGLLGLLDSSTSNLATQ
jgi:subtilisin family serine protease